MHTGPAHLSARPACVVELELKRYLPNVAPACAPVVLTPAPAEAPPTLALTPIPHFELRHSPASFLHALQQSEQHPDTAMTMATAITTIIELTFMITSLSLTLSPRKPFPI